MRSVHRGNGVDDEQREDTLTSAVRQEVLVSMPLSVILECGAARTTRRSSRPVQAPCTPQVDPVPPTVVSEQDEGTRSLQQRSGLRR
jgi:hypothetical protein